MPLSKHFGGHGEEVMKDMRKRYGSRAKSIFYATENKQKKKGMKEHMVDLASSGRVRRNK